MTITLQDIVDSKQLDLPQTLRPLTDAIPFTAKLKSDGKIHVNGLSFSDVDDAMQAVLTLTTQGTLEIGSTGWQFWGWYNKERGAWTPLEHLRAKLSSHRDLSLRTSQTDPLRINEVPIAPYSGRLGITFCPGKKCMGLYGGEWRRDTAQDIEVIEDWGANLLISLMEPHEYETLGVSDFAPLMKNSSMEWLRLPIRDMSIPTLMFEDKWKKQSPHIHARLIKGESVVMHCRGGLGRSGLLAARMLVEMGLDSRSSVDIVRKARPHAIETYEQEEYVLTQHWEQFCMIA